MTCDSKKDVRQYAFHNVEVIGKNAFEHQQHLLSHQDLTVIFDVGAHMGQATTNYRKRFPQAVIHGFEPCPEAFARLSEKFNADRYVKLCQMGFADTKGSRTLFLNQDSSTNSLFPAVLTADTLVEPGRIDNIGHITVPVTTLDAYCQEQYIPSIDILKMDIQGGELRALHGAVHMLSNRSIAIIYLEIWFVRVYEGAPLFYEI